MGRGNWCPNDHVMANCHYFYVDHCGESYDDDDIFDQDLWDMWLCDFYDDLDSAVRKYDPSPTKLKGKWLGRRDVSLLYELENNVYLELADNQTSQAVAIFCYKPDFDEYWYEEDELAAETEAEAQICQVWYNRLLVHMADSYYELRGRSGAWMSHSITEEMVDGARNELMYV